MKRFIREHEAPDLRFADFVSPRRFVELFPMSSSAWPYACRQLCEPIRASASEVARNPRAKVALLHVRGPQNRRRPTVDTYFNGYSMSYTSYTGSFFEVLHNSFKAVSFLR